MTAEMPVDARARTALSLPTYAQVLFYAAVRAAVNLDLPTQRASGTRGRMIIRRLSCPKC